MKWERQFESTREILVHMTILEAEALLKELLDVKFKSIKAQKAADLIGNEYLRAVIYRNPAVKVDKEFAKKLENE